VFQLDPRRQNRFPPRPEIVQVFLVRIRGKSSITNIEGSDTRQVLLGHKHLVLTGERKMTTRTGFGCSRKLSAVKSLALAGGLAMVAVFADSAHAAKPVYPPPHVVTNSQWQQQQLHRELEELRHAQRDLVMLCNEFGKIMQTQGPYMTQQEMSLARGLKGRFEADLRAVQARISEIEGRIARIGSRGVRPPQPPTRVLDPNVCPHCRQRTISLLGVCANRNCPSNR
jgi:hypothetical protein